MTDSIFQDHKDKELAQVRAANRRLVGKISDALKDLPTLENEELVQIKAQRIEKQAEADARAAYAAAAARGVNKAPAPSVSAPLKLPAAEAVATKPGKKETREERQARRYRQCVEAGLKMPTSDYSGMPRGISAVAEKEGITRQAYVEDVKHHINRTWPRSQ